MISKNKKKITYTNKKAKEKKKIIKENKNTDLNKKSKAELIALLEEILK